MIKNHGYHENPENQGSDICRYSAHSQILKILIQTKKETLMNDLNLIAQIDEKIQQLPVEILPQVNDYINFLLQKYQHPTIMIRKSVVEFRDVDREAAKQFLVQLRSNSIVGDVIAPIKENWDATL
ncbi:MAG: hypothetical protein R3E08_01075 [Thiotrichaceae bacterium]